MTLTEMDNLPINDLCNTRFMLGLTPPPPAPIVQRAGTCLHGTCQREVTRFNQSGVCRVHKHLEFCQCKQCEARR